MAHPKTNYIIIGLLLLGGLLCGATQGAEFDNESFPPISGTVYGEVVDGISSLSVNGRAVAIRANNSFSTKVKLAEGEKYLVLQMNYEGIRLIKKYLIIRRPDISTFKVYVPKETIKLPKKIKKHLRRQHRVPPLKVVSKPKKKFSPKVWEYLYVWEFNQGKLLLVKKFKGRYDAEIVIPSQKKWLDFKYLTRKELDQIILAHLGTSEPIA